MLSEQQIGLLLSELNNGLAERDKNATLVLAGGAVMSFVFHLRNATSDIDAYMEPAELLREVAANIADTYDLEKDWLNDGVKGFIDLSKMGTEPVISYSNLNVLRLDDESLLALKLTSARENGKDFSDAAFLMQRLNISSANEALDLVEKYMPHRLLTAKTQFFTEAVFESLNQA